MKSKSTALILILAQLVPAGAGAQATDAGGATIYLPAVSTATMPSPSRSPFPQLLTSPNSPPSAAAAESEPAPAAGLSLARRPSGTGGALVESISLEPIDLNFRDQDLLAILRGFALKFNRNFVTGPGVGGKVTMQLKGVPFDEAFNALLTQMNLVAIQKSANVIEIIRAIDMPALSQVFLLKYRFAPDVLPAILNSLTLKEKVSTVVTVDPASNSVIATSTTDMLQKIKRVLDQLDVESPQISIKARFIEVTAGKTLNWGITWAAQSRFAIGPTGNGQTRAINNFGNMQQDTNGSINTNQTLTHFLTGGILDVSAVLDRKTYYGLINLIMTDSKSKTISEPMILTGNNKSSKIHVGQNLPVLTSLVSQTSTVQQVQYIPEGVDLEVTPIVSPGSNIISFKIKVGVSELLGFQNNAPITTERTAMTEVTVESGKTVVIGGMTRDKVNDQTKGIPILKDIPILGYLFKGRDKSKDRTELLIFITPELLLKEAASRSEPY